MDSEKRMNPALYKAATLGKVATLKHLVDQHLEDLNSTTPHANTVLHLAALHGHAEFASEVLGNKVELLVARPERRR
ncbi:unnamed protein product [Urochloa humidicola]